MTLAEAGDIFRYWEQHPPVHLMVQIVARLLGWQPGGATPARLADLAAAPPPGLAVTTGVPAMPAPLDLETLRARNKALASR